MMSNTKGCLERAKENNQQRRAREARNSFSESRKLLKTNAAHDVSHRASDIIGLSPPLLVSTSTNVPLAFFEQQKQKAQKPPGNPQPVSKGQDAYLSRKRNPVVTRALQPPRGCRRSSSAELLNSCGEEEEESASSSSPSTASGDGTTTLPTISSSGGMCRSLSYGASVGGPGCTAEQATTRWRLRLNKVERAEMAAYSGQIFFAGPSGTAAERSRRRAMCAMASSAESAAEATSAKLQNGGYDDSTGSYIVMPGEHIAFRFEVRAVVGRGSFGQVVRVFDHKLKEEVALKIVKNEARFRDQAQNEIEILKYLRELMERDPSLPFVRFIDSFVFRKHQCMTFEILSINLYELIRRNKFRGFSQALVRKFATTLLRCLRCLAEHRLVHADLKPENILLKESGRSGVKLVDFGSSCFENRRLYSYLQSRFYRAPEVILGCLYGPPIDMWSLGCILAELLTGVPLFPGEDEGDQFALHVELLGMVPVNVMTQAKRLNLFVSSKGYPRYCLSSCTAPETDTRVVLSSARSPSGRRVRGPPASRSWLSALRLREEDTVADGDAVCILDFIQRCLQWDPAVRLTPAQALRHPWIVGAEQQRVTANLNASASLYFSSPTVTNRGPPAPSTVASAPLPTVLYSGQRNAPAADAHVRARPLNPPPRAVTNRPAGDGVCPVNATVPFRRQQ